VVIALESRGTGGEYDPVHGAAADAKIHVLGKRPTAVAGRDQHLTSKVCDLETIFVELEYVVGVRAAQIQTVISDGGGKSMVIGFGRRGEPTVR